MTAEPSPSSRAQSAIHDDPLAPTGEHELPFFSCDGREQALTANLAFLLFVAGAAIGVYQMLSRPLDFGVGYEMVSIAKHFAQYGSFGHPFYVQDTGATAVEPPLYPLALGFLMKFVRSSTALLLLVGTANVIANAFVAAWLPRISSQFLGGPIPGAVASIFWLSSVRLMPSWDASFTAAGLILFCMVSPSWAQRLRTTAFAIAAGGIAGALFLLNNSSIMLSMPWIVWLAYRRHTPVRTAAFQVGVGCIIFAISISPWILRNYLVLGAPVVRTNLGMTVHASLNDCAAPLLAEELASGCYNATHPNVSAVEAGRIATLGEVEYDRRVLNTAKDWILRNPGRFRQLAARRFEEFWFPRSGESTFETVIIWFATALSIPGLVLMCIRREPLAFYITTILLIYPLMYYVVVSDVRYRYPVLWASYLCAGYLAAAGGRRIWNHRRQ